MSITSMVDTDESFSEIEAEPEEWVVVQEEISGIAAADEIHRGYSHLLSFDEQCIGRIEFIDKLEQILQVPKIWNLLNKNAYFFGNLKRLLFWVKNIPPEESENPSEEVIRFCQFQCILQLHGDIIKEGKGDLREYFEQLKKVPVSIKTTESKEGDFDPVHFTQTLTQSLRHDFFTEEEEPVLPDDIDILVTKLTQLASLVLEDIIGIRKGSALADIISDLLSETLKQQIPLWIDPAHLKIPIDNDPRVFLLRQVQYFTRDLHKSLHQLERSEKGRILPDDHDDAVKLIVQLVATIEERNGRSVTSEVGISESILKSTPSAIPAILEAVKAKSVRNLMKKLSPSECIGVQSSVQKVLELALTKFMKSFTNPVLWLVLFQRIPMLMATQSLSWPKLSKPHFQHIEKDIMHDLGAQVMQVLSSLASLSRPKGVSGFLVRMGRHVLKYFVDDIGLSIAQEISNPIRIRKISIICDTIQHLFWDVHDNGDFVFIEDQTVFKNLSEQLRKAKSESESISQCQNPTGDMREMVMLDLVTTLMESLKKNVPESMAKKYLFPKSVKSMQQLIWNLLDVLVGISQSPELLEFILLQYFVYPSCQ